MANNLLSDSLPRNLGSLTNLKSLVLTNNYIRGPMPLSVSQLKKLRDFHVFSPYPSESMAVPRGFNKQTFHRIYVDGPRLGMNSVCWDDAQVFGINNQEPVVMKDEGDDTEIIERKKKP
jgi:hypothetical protein